MYLRAKTDIFEDHPLLYYDMQHIVKIHEKNFLAKVERPKFRMVKPRDAERLLLEVCEKEFGFEKIRFF